MTVEVETPSISYTADGVVSVYAYDFKILAEGDLSVYEDEVLTTKGYNVSGVGNDGGGNVTFTGDVPADDVVVTLTREMTYEQQTDYTPYDNFPAETHEAALDKLCMLVQQVKELFERVPHIAVGHGFSAAETELTPSGNTVIGFNATGTALALYAAASLGAYDITDFFKKNEVNTFEKNQVMDDVAYSASTGALTPDAQYPFYDIDLDANLTVNLATVVNAAVATILLRVKQDAIGSRTLTFNASYKTMSGDVAVNSTAEKVTWYEMIVDGINNESWLTKIGEEV
jgi:hypothetical protein